MKIREFLTIFKIRNNSLSGRGRGSAVRFLFGLIIIRNVNETFMSDTETRPRSLTLHPRRDRDETFTKTLRDRDVRFFARDETETRRPKYVPRRDRDNLKQSLSSHNLDALSSWLLHKFIQYTYPMNS